VTRRWVQWETSCQSSRDQQYYYNANGRTIVILSLSVPHTICDSSFMRLLCSIGFCNNKVVLNVQPLVCGCVWYVAQYTSHMTKSRFHL
jgi:hypothetical protein